jgi:pimeloyl-ACP methyl ester carboxylesterase
MIMQPPYIRSTGEGPVIICLHSSASSSKQWQALINRMSSEFRVMAVDLYGYGKSPAWRGERKLALTDEVALLRPIIEGLDGNFHLVGHSYGGAVALEAARVYPDRVVSLTVYEPVLFSLLFQDDPAQIAAREIRAVENEVRHQVLSGRPEAAGERFVSYWSSNGLWQKLEDWQRNVIVEKMIKVVSDFDAAFGNPTTLAQFQTLDIPTLLLVGMSSPKSTRRIAELLGKTLPLVEVQALSGMGHMGPVTHAEQVNTLIDRFVHDQGKRAEAALDDRLQPLSRGQLEEEHNVA